MTKLIAALLLRSVEAGTKTQVWGNISGSKLSGVMVIIFACLGYALGRMDVEAAGTAIAFGIGMIRLREGQSKETAKVTEHLKAQDARLATLDILLEKVEYLTGEKP
mgnify:CR=1 FL=1